MNIEPLSTAHPSHLAISLSPTIDIRITTISPSTCPPTPPSHSLSSRPNNHQPSTNPPSRPPPLALLIPSNLLTTHPSPTHHHIPISSPTSLSTRHNASIRTSRPFLSPPKPSPQLHKITSTTITHAISAGYNSANSECASPHLSMAT